MAYESRRLNDCAVVALSNYFNLPYEDVDNELDSIYQSLGLTWIREAGTNKLVHNIFMARRDMFDKKVPRRGQEKMSGVIITVNSNHDKGHMAVVRNGYVYDCTSPNGMALPIWRAFVRCKNICEYWVKD